MYPLNVIKRMNADELSTQIAKERLFGLRLLNRVIKHLESLSYKMDNAFSLGFREWLDKQEDAISILRTAKNNVVRASRTKALLPINPDEYFDPKTEVVEVIVIDFDAIERRLIASLIPDEDVIPMLPFQASVGWGEHYAHIRNESLYVIETNAHGIPNGETLCARGINEPKTLIGPYTGVGPLATVPTCPGCLAKAKSIIARHVTK